jgi:two-component system phosphate regulon sensor histidine kinase PhoR
VVELHAPAAQQKRQTLRSEVPADLPALFANSDYLERAISNLVDNAIKYTPEGGTISVGARIEKAKTVIEVSDDGIGIPPDDLPRIFERFYRVDRSRSRAMGGTGLGLSIVKHVAQAHTGRVIVTSTVGKGSTFVLEIPLIPPAQQ